MKKALLIFCWLYSVNCFAQTKTSYSLLTGTIGRYPITMHLHQLAHSYFGYYYYNSTEQPVYFTGEDTSNKSKIQLTTFGLNTTEHFSFSWNDKVTGGTWKQDGSNKDLNLSLTQTQLPLHFTFESLQGKVALRKSLKNSPQATFKASSVWATGSSLTDAFVQSVIRKMFGDSSSQNDIVEILYKNKQLFFNDYIKSNNDVKEADLGASLNYEEADNLCVSFQSAKLLSLAFDTYAFTGGAHGNHGTIYASYDLVHNQKISLTDILNTEGIKKLEPLLENNFRKQHDLQPTDSLTTGGLFDNEIKPNDNFYVTGKGINFAYTPYEIAPYVMGEIEIFVSFKDLNFYLQPRFQSLLN